MINDEKYRPAVYFRVLGSLLYNEPEERTVETLAGEGLFTELPYAGGNAAVKSGRAAFLEWLASGTVKELTEVAREDYMRLFVGAGKVLAPPWGSVYLNTDRLLFTEETLNVRKYYESRGVKLIKKYKEPDDHIGLELEFVSKMLEAGNVADAEEFARLHMLPWVPSWLTDMKKHARTGYYKGLAEIAYGSLLELAER